MHRLVIIGLIACRADVPVAPIGHAPAPAPRVVAAPPLPNRQLARLTPSELFGVVLGMPYAALARARPGIALDPDEHFEFRQHYLETLPGMVVHYYVLRDGSATYQISIELADELAAQQLWDRYTDRGTLIDDLGGKEIVIEGYAFQIRVWTHGSRVQLMAVIEGSEWWNQYHAKDTLDGRPPGDGDGGTVIP